MKENLDNLIRFNSANVLVSVVDSCEKESNREAILADIHSSENFLAALKQCLISQQEGSR